MLFFAWPDHALAGSVGLFLFEVVTEGVSLTGCVTMSDNKKVRNEV